MEFTRDRYWRNKEESYLEWQNVLLPEVGAQEPHAAVDVEADAPGGHHAHRVAHVEGRHVACHGEESWLD